MSNFYDDFRTADAAQTYGKLKCAELEIHRVQAIRDVLKQYHKMANGTKCGCLLDVGCGPGTTARILSESFEQSIGVDPSENLLYQAQNTACPNSITFKVGGAESLPVAESSTDVITVVFALHFIQCDRFIAECRRVLKPGGIAVFHVAVLSNVLFTGRHEIMPDAAPLVKEMNDKCADIAKELNHPERHLLDSHEALYNDIEWKGKRRILAEHKVVFPLAELRRHYMSIPFYRRLGDGKQNPVIEFVGSLKRLWSIEDVDDDKFEICACYRAVTIVLPK